MRQGGYAINAASHQNGEPVVELGGTRLELRPERAIHWLERRTLIVADLHWGKSETFRAHGIPIPDGQLEDDLGRLSRALDRTGAARLVVLGDLVHAREGITGAVREQVARWRERQAAGLEVVLIRGNHDRHLRDLPPEWRIDAVDGAIEEAGLRLAHHPEPEAGRYVLSGHLHPVYALRERAGRLVLPCFHLGREVAVLPAFSAFTGGVRMSRRKDERVFVIADDTVVEV